MKNILLIASGVVFLSIILTYVMPDGKLKNSINFILRTVCVLTLITPITQFFFSDNSSIDVNYGDVANIYRLNQEEYLESVILREFDVECDCLLNIDYVDNKIIENGVTIYLLENFNEADKIYSYLTNLGYINIIVNG